MAERAVQGSLFGPSRPVGPALSARQARVLDALERLGRLTVDEAGAVAHELRRGRPHDRDERCEWCAEDGRAVLDRLVELGYARQRRAGGPVFYVPVDVEARAGGAAREEGEIPW